MPSETQLAWLALMVSAVIAAIGTWAYSSVVRAWERAADLNQENIQLKERIAELEAKS